MTEDKGLHHEPVLLKEALDALHIKSQARYIDATLGAGGHTIEIIKHGGIVLGLDADESMLKIAKERIKDACPVPNTLVGDLYSLVHSNFRDIDQAAKANGFDKVDGILLDLGISAIHLESNKRGFSFRHLQSPLDMRLSEENQKVRAADLLNSLREDQLQELLIKVGEIPWKEAHSLSKKIIQRRQDTPFSTVGDLVEAIEDTGITGGRINPATKVFMALRIAVNSELVTLEESLPKAFALLKNNGRLVVISFHSGEDAIVKHFMKNMVGEGMGKLIYKQAITPTPQEIEKNSKARSAKLRAIERI